MKRYLQLALFVVLGILIVLVLVAPLGPMPGIFIGGSAAEAPAQWQDTSDVHEILLKAPGTIPRVVTIWVIDHEGDLYVVGSRESGWVQAIGEGGPVELRLGDDTYALDASVVTDGWEPILQAYVDKYRPDYPEIIAGFPSIEEARGSVAVFRLDR